MRKYTARFVIIVIAVMTIVNVTKQTAMGIKDNDRDDESPKIDFFYVPNW